VRAPRDYASVQKRRLVVSSAALLAAALLAGAVPAARGDLDRSFGSGGKVTTDFGGSEAGSAIALHRDGRVVVAGRLFAPGPNDDFLLAQYTAGGALDPTFDGDGKVTTDFTGQFDGAFGIAVQRDGKIVVAGYGYPSTGLGPQDFAVARYNLDGSLDPTFGAGGKVLTTFEPTSLDAAFAVTLQPDGKIVVAGRSRRAQTYDFAVARYMPNGALDASFAGDGLVVTQVSLQNDVATALAIQPDGKIVVVGGTLPGPDSSFDLALVRYNADGSLDAGFDSDGFVVGSTPERHDLIEDVAVLSNGKLLLATGSGVMRLTSSGSVDSSFVAPERASTDVVFVSALAVQPDRKILAIGTVFRPGGASDFGVARLTPDGLIDTSFGSQGTVVTDFGPQDQASDGELQPDGRLVVTGVTSQSVTGPADFAVARYLAVQFCVVPNVRGRTLNAARAALRLFSCRVGKVDRAYSSRVKKGRVLSQRPAPRTRLAEPANVSLVVSRGPRR
jgi:uncharacterized delta-60 repeat protein